MKYLSLSFLLILGSFQFAHGDCGGCASEASKSAKSSLSGCASEQLATYFAVQEGLAADDLVAAQAGASAFLAYAESASCSEGKGCSCSVELSTAEVIVDAADLSAARAAFKDWSEALLAKVEKGGLEGSVVYKMHCPMAFNNAGGTWLQAGEDLRNPYYGSMMLTCGLQTGSFGGSASEDKGGCSSSSACCEEKKPSCCDS